MAEINQHVLPLFIGAIIGTGGSSLYFSEQAEKNIESIEQQGPRQINEKLDKINCSIQINEINEALRFCEHELKDCT